MKLRKVPAFALLAPAMLASVLIAYSQTPAPFSLTVSTAKPEVKVGGLIFVDVVMTNTSDHDISCDSYWHDAIDQNYRYDVVYEDGQPAEKIVRKTPSDAYPCIIGPGQTSKSGGAVNRIFDFSRPGKYTIQVSRDVWGDDSKPNTWQTHQNDPEIEIKSNIITITVVATPPPAAPPR